MAAGLLAWARSRLGRAVLGLVGLVLVSLLIAHTGWERAVHSMSTAAVRLPLVFALEGALLTCDAITLHRLFAPPHRPPWLMVLRATLIGSTVAGLLPAGRAVAEGVKASLLSPYSGGARATVAALRSQTALLLSNGLMSLVALVAAITAASAAPIVAWAMGGNAGLMFVIAFGVLLAGRGMGLGGFIGKRWRRAERLGPEVDQVWRAEPLIPAGAVFTQLVARTVTVVQLAVLIGAFHAAAATDLEVVLLSEGLLLVGGTIGDLLPAQLGATDANFMLSSAVLGLGASEALAIPLLLRVARLGWAGVGALVPTFWPIAKVPTTAQGEGR